MTFAPIFLRQYFCAKKLQSHNLTREKLHEALSYKIVTRKMLMKLTPGTKAACKMAMN